MPWAILGISWLMAFAMMAPIYCVPPMEHILKEELLLNHTQTILLYAAPLIMIVAAAIPGGFIADKIGIKRSAGISIIIVVIGTVLRGMATTPSSLLAFTFIYGAGLGLSFPNLQKLVSIWVPREKAGIGTGIFATGILTATALPLAITMPLIFPITNNFQGVFAFWSIPPIIAAIVWWLRIKEPPKDINSNSLAIDHRMLLRKVLRNGGIWLVAILFFLHDFYFSTWAGWAPTLMLLKGATPHMAGVIASVTIWVGIPTVFFIPRLSYKLGLRKPFLWIPGIAAAFIAWGTIEASIPLSWVLMALIGFVLEMRFVTIMALPVEISPKEEVGMASGLVLSVGFAGGVCGSLIAGRILDLTGSLNSALIVLIAVSIAATAVALRIPETGPKAKLKKMEPRSLEEVDQS